MLIQKSPRRDYRGPLDARHPRVSAVLGSKASAKRRCSEGGVGAMGKVLAGQLQELGIASDSVKQVIVTHAHPDHVMAVPAFRRMFSGRRRSCVGDRRQDARQRESHRRIRRRGPAADRGPAEIGLDSRATPPRAVGREADRRGPRAHRRRHRGRRRPCVHGPRDSRHSDCSLSFHEPHAGSSSFPTPPGTTCLTKMPGGRNYSRITASTWLRSAGLRPSAPRCSA